MSLASTIHEKFAARLQHEQIKTRWKFWVQELGNRKRAVNTNPEACQEVREKLESIAAAAEAVGLLSLPSIPEDLAQWLDDDEVFFGLEEMIVKRPTQALGMNTGQRPLRPKASDAGTGKNNGMSNSGGGIKSLTSLTSLPKEQLMDDFPGGVKGRDWEKKVEQETRKEYNMALGNKPVDAAVADPTQAAVATPQAEATPATPGNPDTPNPQPTLTKAEKLKAQNAVRKANLAEKKTTKGEAEPKAPKVKKEKVLGPCLDGCGQQVGGRFAVGHDAKLKSLLVKVERGEVGTEDIPEVAQPYIKLKKAGVEETTAKDGTKVKVQHFEITKSPVRFPGRPEIEYAILEDGRGN